MKKLMIVVMTMLLAGPVYAAQEAKNSIGVNVGYFNADPDVNLNFSFDSDLWDSSIWEGHTITVNKVVTTPLNLEFTKYYSDNFALGLNIGSWSERGDIKGGILSDSFIFDDGIDLWSVGVAHSLQGTQELTVIPAELNVQFYVPSKAIFRPYFLAGLLLWSVKYQNNLDTREVSVETNLSTGLTDIYTVDTNIQVESSKTVLGGKLGIGGNLPISDTLLLTGQIAYQLLQADLGTVSKSGVGTFRLGSWKFNSPVFTLGIALMF